MTIRPGLPSNYRAMGDALTAAWEDTCPAPRLRTEFRVVMPMMADVNHKDEVKTITPRSGEIDIGTYQVLRYTTTD